MILVVEDDPSSATVVRDALEFEGCRVTCVASGEQACEAIVRGLVPDVALVDYLLPGMNGIETVARMREMPQLAATRYLLVTASVMSHQTAEFKAAGIGHYAKPIRRPELMARIRELMAAS
jgi:two-component system phosphate regulon response regulator PhoB